jgi:hypothetical protein
MRNSVIRVVAILVLAALTLQISGCSAIMFGVGSAVDHSESRMKYVPGQQWSGISPGTKVTVVRTDSTKVMGKLVEFARLSGEEYRARFADAPVPGAESTSVVVIAADSANVSIPLNQIDGIMVKNHSHYKWIFLGIGLVIDASTVLLFLLLDKMELFGGGSWGYISAH